jgi:hypothetical protein
MGMVEHAVLAQAHSIVLASLGVFQISIRPVAVWLPGVFSFRAQVV